MQWYISTYNIKYVFFRKSALCESPRYLFLILLNLMFILIFCTLIYVGFKKIKNTNFFLSVTIFLFA